MRVVKHDKKIRDIVEIISTVLEAILAVVIIVVVVMGIVFLKTPIQEYIADSANPDAILTLLNYVLNIIIGVELFRMLCKPGTGTVLEVILFVIVRHMIIHDTGALENFLTVLGVAVLIMVKRYVLDEKLPGFIKKHRETAESENDSRPQ
ncbi:MAG: hypothetical protein LUC41_07720 [Clostridiales bacterium]|nr:hypothetical protein [Clostridiales bacterium]